MIHVYSCNDSKILITNQIQYIIGNNIMTNDIDYNNYCCFWYNDFSTFMMNLIEVLMKRKMITNEDFEYDEDINKNQIRFEFMKLNFEFWKSIFISKTPTILEYYDRKPIINQIEKYIIKYC